MIFLVEREWLPQETRGQAACPSGCTAGSGGRRRAGRQARVPPLGIRELQTPSPCRAADLSSLSRGPCRRGNMSDAWSSQPGPPPLQPTRSQAKDKATRREGSPQSAGSGPGLEPVSLWVPALACTHPQSRGSSLALWGRACCRWTSGGGRQPCRRPGCPSRHTPPASASADRVVDLHLQLWCGRNGVKFL